MSYTNEENIENYLGRDLTASEQAILELVIASVESYINEQIGGSFGTGTTTTKYYDGGSKILDIDPCVNITAVRSVDNEESTIYEYVLGSDLESRPRNDTLKTWIELRGGIFPDGTTNIGVAATFTMGTTVPDDIEYLATYMAGNLLRRMSEGNLKSESIEGYSRTFAEFQNQDETINLVLNKYIKNNIVI